MKTPKITIITVVYNAEKTIEQTIKSVIAQSYPDIEYIIIDGKSDDGTIDIINKYRSKISLFISEEDNGIYDAMNKGINHSSGEILFFLNADDYLVDNEVIGEIIEKYRNCNCDLLYGYVNIEYLINNKPSFQKYAYEFTLENLRKGCQPPHQGLFIKKQVFTESGLFDLNFKSASDFEFYCRIIDKNYSHVYIDKLISIFKYGGTSSNFFSDYESIKIINKYFGKYYGMLYYFKRIIIRGLLYKFKLINVYRYMRNNLK